MKKILTSLVVFSAIMFSMNATFACEKCNCGDENCVNCDCEKINCECGCKKKCNCGCDENCNCCKDGVCKCQKRFLKIFKKKCKCNK